MLPLGMPDVTHTARCPVPDCSEHAKPHEQIASRATLCEMFDPDGSDGIFFLQHCGNVFRSRLVLIRPPQLLK